jgi:hypothetical protein
MLLYNCVVMFTGRFQKEYVELDHTAMHRLVLDLRRKSCDEIFQYSLINYLPTYSMEQSPS